MSLAVALQNVLESCHAVIQYNLNWLLKVLKKSPSKFQIHEIETTISREMLRGMFM